MFRNGEIIAVIVYGIPNCDTIKKTKRLLDEKEKEYTFVNVRKSPISLEKLQVISEAVGLDVLINKRGMMYRKLGLKEKNLTDQELLQVIYNEQAIIKRPLIEKAGNYHVGYDAEKILNL